MTEQHMLPIVGAKFRPPAQGLLDVLAHSTPLVLRREPGNEYDINAIMVLVASSALAFGEGAEERFAKVLEGYGLTPEDLRARSEWHLGYIPRGDAAQLAPRIDAGERVVRCALGFGVDGRPSVRFELAPSASALRDDVARSTEDAT
jgi:hypothetical protein